MCIFIYEATELEKKTPKSIGKKLSLITTVAIFVLNYNVSYFMSLITTASQMLPLISTVQSFFVPNYDDQLLLVPNNDASLQN